MIFHFSIVHVCFVFCYFNYIVLFLLLIKYYHFMFIIVVFRLGKCKIRFFYCLLQGTSTGCDFSLRGRVDDFYFGLFKSILFCVN